MTALASGWLVATTPGSVVVLGPTVEIAVDVEDEAAASGLARCLVERSGAEDEDVRDLIALLDRSGAYRDGAAPEGTPLAAALEALRRDGQAPAGVVWTAEEALVLPEAWPERARVRALEAFVAGLAPDARLVAYALGEVVGDVPDAGRLRRRREETAPGAGGGEPTARVFSLADGGRCDRATEADLETMNASAAHRLGPVVSVGAPEVVDPDLPELTLAVARIAAPDARTPTTTDARTTQGVGAPDVARHVALAEAAERFAAARVPVGLVRAERAGLEDAVDPRALYDGAVGVDADGERLWAPVVGRDGKRWHVPAEAVWLAAPEATIPWTGSGVAAGTSPADARARALRELVERDAFMVCWLRGVGRERIAPRGVPEDAARMARVLEGHGWRTTWVDLTRDTLPVVLCCLTHEREGLTLGAACAPTAAAALRRATVEALVLALRFRSDGPPPAPEAVRTPRDHLMLHRDPARAADHAFLYNSPDEVALTDIAAGGSEPLEERLAALGHPPLYADLTVPACGPFHVVRAIAPGLVPLTFGHGTEPYNMSRVGDAADETRPRVPHPFP